MQNIFLMENGNLQLIDNEAALMNTWRNCGFDSIFVPTTQKQEIVRLTNAYVQKLAGRENVPVNRVDPQVREPPVHHVSGFASCLYVDDKRTACRLRTVPVQPAHVLYSSMHWHVCMVLLAKLLDEPTKLPGSLPAAPVGLPLLRGGGQAGH